MHTYIHVLIQKSAEDPAGVFLRCVSTIGIWGKDGLCCVFDVTFSELLLSGFIVRKHTVKHVCQFANKSSRPSIVAEYSGQAEFSRAAVWRSDRGSRDTSVQSPTQRSRQRFWLKRNSRELSALRSLWSYCECFWNSFLLPLRSLCAMSLR